MLFPLALQGAQCEDPGGIGEGKNILVTLYTAAEFCLRPQKPVLQADSSTLTSLGRLEGAGKRTDGNGFALENPSRTVRMDESGVLVGRHF